VPKSSADGELIEAIRAVARGDRYIPPAIAIRVADARAEAARTSERSQLSRRELDVLRLLGLGYSNKEIASALFITVRTVESHRAHLMQKTGARSRAEVVRVAMELGLLEARG
jgi:DNA-binding NarL/FixJ family response regulator